MRDASICGLGQAAPNPVGLRAPLLPPRGVEAMARHERAGPDVDRVHAQRRAGRRRAGRDAAQVAKRFGVRHPAPVREERPASRPATAAPAWSRSKGERTLAPSCCRTPTPGMTVRQRQRPRRGRAEMVLELLTSDAGAASAEHTHESELLFWADVDGAARPPAGPRPGHREGRLAPGHRGQPRRLHPVHALHPRLPRRAGQRRARPGDARRAREDRVRPGRRRASQSSCVACGECVQACPTGALMPARGAGLREDRSAQVDSVCPYCGVGCQLTLHVGHDDEGAEKIHVVTGRDGPANHGRLCVKGRFGFDYVHNAAASPRR